MTRARVLADYVAGGSTAAEFDVLDGLTSTTAELNILDGVTSTAAELNILDGVTSTAAELNHVDGVTSNVQTQLNAKAPLASPTFTGNFTSVGIDDNADATAITIKSDETVGVRNTDPTPHNGVGIHIGDGSTSTASLAIEDDEKQWDVYVNGGMVLRNTTASRDMLSLAEESGDVTVNTGNLVIGTAGKGITFSSTNTPAQSAGTGTHNTLDDYEEGTWTPSLGGSTTYNTQTGHYTRIGRLVVASLYMGITSIGSGSARNIYGLPFTSGSATGTMSVSWWNDLASNVNYMAGYTYGMSYITMYANSTPTKSYGTINIFEDGTYLQGTCTYIVG